MQKYEYGTLSHPRSIRVIDLSPSSQYSRPLAIHLREVALDTSQFEALSYSWEGQKFTQIIECDGRELTITATCEAALRRLRLAKRTRVLWIDQICINQETVDEKNQQVALMGDLYRIAEKVVVWLGVQPAADKIIEYVNLYRLLGLWKKVPFAGRLQYHMRFKLEHKLWEKVHLQLPALHPVSWFDRMWTIQEVAVAQQIQIISSRRAMDYDQFISSLNLWLTERVNQPVGGEMFGHIKMEADATTHLLGARKDIRDFLLPIPGEQNQSPDTNISELICHITAASASVASDKIFALHGMLKALGIILPPPDYNLPTSEVYWRASCIFMQKQNSLEMLSIVNGSGNFKDVPSWVPDFSRSSPRWEMNSAWFHASGYWRKQRQSFVFKNEQRILVTKAKIIDIVREVVSGSVDSVLHIIGNPSDPNDRADLFLGKSLPANIQVVQILRSWIRAGLGLRTSPTIWKSPIDPITLVAHQSGNLITQIMANPELERMNEMMGYIWLAMTDPDQISLHYQIALMSGKFPRSFLQNPGFLLRNNLIEAQLLLVLIDKDLYGSLLNAWKRAIGNVFLTTRDGYVGTGPVETKAGDIIALIPGVKTPLILRVSDSLASGRYKVIGPAFVNGVMEGERWDEHLSVEERKRGIEYLGHDLPEISLE